jgi:MSHA biogenesis protein MshI
VFGIRRKAAGVAGLVSIGLEPDGFALAHVTRNDRGEPWLERCEFHPVARREDVGRTLADIVTQERLSGARCVFVLGPADYALRVVDAPDVPVEELRSAARWSIKDLVDFDVEKAVIDVFESPQSPSSRHTARTYVVAAPEQVVSEIVEIARTSGLELVAIDTTELAIRNVAALHPGDQDGIAVVSLRRDVSLITVSREGYLYVARWVNVSLDELSDLKEKDPEGPVTGYESEANAELEALLLELQRSLDYYDHELRQQPLRALALSPSEMDLSSLGAQLASSVHLSLETLDLNNLVAMSGELPPDLQFRCLPTVGAALRVEQGTA